MAWRGSPVFSRPEDAICYALARHAPRLESKREAHEWIEELTGGGGLVALARRPEYREWRRAALSPLAARFDYPNPGWVARLNAEIASTRHRLPDLEPRFEHGYEKGVDAAPILFRSQVVDPLFRMASADTGEVGP